MFCLRSWLPLLFIPTNASPTFIFLFFVCSYFLNRPCVYCSFLLLILFLTSCNWSERCFFDFSGNWFEPRPPLAAFATPAAGAGNASASALGGGCVSCLGGHGHANATAAAALEDTFGPTAALAVDALNSTVSAVAGAAVEQLAQTKAEWTGIGMEWLRSLLGRREWRIECLDVYIRL